MNAEEGLFLAHNVRSRLSGLRGATDNLGLTWTAREPPLPFQGVSQPARRGRLQTSNLLFQKGAGRCSSNVNFLYVICNERLDAAVDYVLVTHQSF